MSRCARGDGAQQRCTEWLGEVNGWLLAHKGLRVLLYWTSRTFWVVEDLLAVPRDTVRRGKVISVEERRFDLECRMRGLSDSGRLVFTQNVFKV